MDQNSSQDGYNAYLNGKSRGSNPHINGTTPYYDWDYGWSLGADDDQDRSASDQAMDYAQEIVARQLAKRY